LVRRGPEPGQLASGDQLFFGAEQQPPEAARVGVAQLAAVVERKHDVGVRSLGILGKLVQQLPGHPEMNH